MSMTVRLSLLVFTLLGCYAHAAMAKDGSGSVMAPEQTARFPSFSVYFIFWFSPGSSE